MVNINELRLARDMAERAHQDCLRRIRSFERLITEADPRDGDDYADLLNRLHALEELYSIMREIKALIESIEQKDLVVDANSLERALSSVRRSRIRAYGG